MSKEPPTNNRQRVAPPTNPKPLGALLRFSKNKMKHQTVQEDPHEKYQV